MACCVSIGDWMVRDRFMRKTSASCVRRYRRLNGGTPIAINFRLVRCIEPQEEATRIIFDNDHWMAVDHSFGDVAADFESAFDTSAEI